MFILRERILMDGEKQYLFTLNVKYLENLFIDCDDQVIMSRHLLKDFFEKEKENKHYFSLLCENHSLNFKIKEQIEHFFDNMPISKNDMNEEIITLKQDETILIETSILARESIKLELQKFYNISSEYN